MEGGGVVATTVDSLSIDISAQAKSANDSLDALVRRLDKITSSLTRAGGSGMGQMAVGVSRLSDAMLKMKAVNASDFTRLAKNMSSIGQIDSGKVRSTAVAISGLGKALTSINATSGGTEAAKQISELATGISRLGYKSADKAITNIPLLANSMKDLMKTLSGAPKVSQNLIDMTNALANLAKTGASSGRAANSLASSLNTYSRSAKKAKGHSFSLASAIGRVYATYWMLFRAAGAIGDAIDISSSLTETQNVVRQTFGEYESLVNDFAKTSLQDYGMSELTAKQIAGRFQSMGTAMGIAKGQMADMSLELTGLAGDLASFYNADQNEVAKKLNSIFTGETEPLRSYGIDLTNATIQQWALNKGMQVNVNTMEQMEKAMLRYEYVMERTQNAQGDFARTIDTWANQVRLLKGQLQQLGGIIGGTFINALKPFVKALNYVMSHVIAFAETVSNALGKIFGWKYEVSGGGIATEYDSAAGYADDLADATGTAAGNAEKLRKTLSVLAFDELNQLTAKQDNDSGSAGSGGGGLSGAGAGSGGGEWTQVDTMFEDYKSEIDTLYELGDYIGDTLTSAMESIDWQSIYKKASGFGKGLADFLNGLISPQLFGALGGTIGSSITTALHFLNSFGTNFNWSAFGYSIAAGINNFFKKTDFKLAADTVNKFAIGILDSIIAGLKGTDWNQIGLKIRDFIVGIEWLTILKKVGEVIWEALKGAITMTWEIFKGDDIEARIVAVLLGMKFLSLGTSLGTKLWRAIKGSATNKTVVDTASKSIATMISGKISAEITKQVDKIKPSFNGLKKSLTDALKPALGQGLVYVGILELGVQLDKLTDKVRGGNGQLSEYGGILDSIGSNYAPNVSDELFFLKESLEDSDATMEEVIKTLVEYYKEAGIGAEQLRTDFNNVGGSANTTAEQIEVMNAVIDQIPEEGNLAETSLNAMKDALKLLQQEGIIPSNEHMTSLLTSLDQSASSGLTAEEAWNALTLEMQNMSIETDNLNTVLGEDFFVAAGIAKSASDNLTASLQTNERETNKSANNIKKTYKGAQSVIGTVLANILTKSDTTWSGVGSKTATVMGNMFEKVGLTFPGILAKVEEVNAGISSDVNTEWQAAENKITSAVTGMDAETLSKMSSMDSTVISKNASIKGYITRSWKDASDTVTTKLGEMYTETNLTLNDIVNLFSGLGDRIKNSMNMYTKGQSAAQSFAKGIKSVKIPMPHIKVNASTTKSDYGYSYNMNSSVSWYRNGGFLSGELWGMNENGNPEMVGKVGNGRTGIANNEIITEAIRAAVVDGMMEAFMNQSMSNNDNQQPIQEITLRTESDEVLARAVIRGQERIDRRMNPTPRFAY